MILCDLPAWAGEKQIARPAKRITRVHEEFVGDLSQVLRIERVVGTCELAKKVARFDLRFDFYHKGKRLEKKSKGWGLKLTETEAASSVKCAVHLIDLDYLPLGGGKPGHQRIHFQFAAGTMVMGSSFDIAKSEFDATDGAPLNIFSAGAARGDEVPLFYAIAKSSSINAGRTPAEVVRSNPDADVLVVTLKLK